MNPVLLHITTVPMSLVFLERQVGYMKQRGLSVHVLSSPGAELSSFGTRERVPVHAAEMTRRVTPMRDLRAVLELLRIMRAIRPAIVHAHTPKGGLLGMVAATLTRAPVRIYHMRGLPLMGATGIRRRLLWSTEWLACRLAHQVLCVSHSIRREAVAAGICPPAKAHVLLGGSGNGVDAIGRFRPAADTSSRDRTRARFGIPPHATAIGFVGRVVRDKGVVELVEAWNRLRSRYPSLHLLIVGPFEEQDPVPSATVASLRSDRRIHMAGEDWDTPPLYAAMDMVALPTYREGFPNVVLEASAMGLPVVATRVPGCIDAVIEGETGLLVPARDSAALESALTRYIEDPALRRTHGAAGRARVLREFAQEGLWGALFDVYSRMLADRGMAITPHSAGRGQRAYTAAAT